MQQEQQLTCGKCKLKMSTPAASVFTEVKRGAEQAFGTEHGEVLEYIVKMIGDWYSDREWDTGHQHGIDTGMDIEDCIQLLRNMEQNVGQNSQGMQMCRLHETENALFFNQREQSIRELYGQDMVVNSIYELTKNVWHQDGTPKKLELDLIFKYDNDIPNHTNCIIMLRR